MNSDCKDRYFENIIHANNDNMRNITNKMAFPQRIKKDGISPIIFLTFSLRSSICSCSNLAFSFISSYFPIIQFPSSN
ncbi:hypothetical protein EVA_10278 [gut metagenome]|uniref:Uncharacterized protein n=1 Tax=gut metagenome TaxID=749906 RepID=J9G350_9ZZZZ